MLMYRFYPTPQGSSDPSYVSNFYLLSLIVKNLAVLTYNVQVGQIHHTYMMYFYTWPTMYINTYLFKCHTLIISELLTHALYEKHIHITRVEHFYTLLFVFSFMDYSHHPVFQSNLLALLFPSLISGLMLFKKLLVLMKSYWSIYQKSIFGTLLLQYNINREEYTNHKCRTWCIFTNWNFLVTSISEAQSCPPLTTVHSFQ